MFGCFTASFYLCQLSFVPFFPVQTPTPPAVGAVVILCWALVVLLGTFAPEHVFHPHLIHNPLRLPILTLLVPVAFLFGYVGVCELSPELFQ